MDWTGLTLLQGGEVCRQNNKEDYGRWYREKYTLSVSREKCEWCKLLGLPHSQN